MKSFRDLSISSKLTIIIMANCCAALLVGGTTLTARYAMREENQLADRIAVLTRVIGSNNAANLAFGDRVAAEETLSALAAEPSVLNASVYDTNDHLFAHFNARESTSGPPEIDFGAVVLEHPELRSGKPVFRGDAVRVTSPILLDGEKKGFVLLTADLGPVRTAVIKDAAMFFIITLATGLVALLFCLRLQKIVSGPINGLVQAMRHVSRSKHYSMRLEKHGDDEIGFLIDGFNDMLEQLRLRDEKVERHRRQLEHAQRIAQLGHWEWCGEENRLVMSDQAIQVLGVPSVKGKADLYTFLEWTHPNDRDRMTATVRQVVEDQIPLDVEFRVVHHADQARFVHLRGEVTQGSGQGIRITGSVQDVTERVQAAEKLRIAANALESTGDAIMILNAELRIITVNKAFCRDTGFSLEDVYGQSPAFLQSDKHDRNHYNTIVAHIAHDGSWSGEVWSKRKSGGTYPQWITVNEVRDEAGALSHYVSVGKDISQYKEYESRLEYLAHHDVLTKLPNRALFEAQLRETLLRAGRNDYGVAVIFVDLDHFKTINDSLGHAVGDQLLQVASERIKNCLRDSDMVARQGGDEFTVLLDHLRDVQDAARVADKLNRELARPFDLNGNDLYISASIGISCFSDDGREPDDLLRNADAAMYVIKEQGRNGYQFYSAMAQIKAMEILTMTNSLHCALARNEFRIHYQPRINLSTCEIVGFEALVRWQHPELGLQAPAQFIPLAEKTGLIDAIGDWVLHGACVQTKAWHDEGLGPLCVAVNLSVRQFRQPGLTRRIDEILRQTGLEPQFLHVEITESMMMVDYERTAATLLELHEMGIGIAVDDFGTGYSSLSYLKRFPLDFLKIDKSFVENIPADQENVAITNAIIALAKSLKLGIVAEGVETPLQQKFLLDAGCDEAQGYLFSKPLPPAELRTLLAVARPCATCAASSLGMCDRDVLSWQDGRISIPYLEK
ncbi:MAG: EAL domain-containing protein [Bacteroidota bacterium]